MEMAARLDVYFKKDILIFYVSMSIFKKETLFQNIVRNLYNVIGVILVWRGIWLILDSIDRAVYGGNHWATGLMGTLLGLALLYLPHRKIDVLT